MALRVDFKLSVIFIREGKRFVAYAPAIDLSTSGRNFEEAKRHFEEAAEIFFEEISRKGTLNDALLDLGWAKQRNTWQPPMVVSQGLETITIPVAVS